MRLSPLKARIALGCFVIVGGATGTNLVYLQDTAVVSKVARAKVDRAKQRAETERTRRLALDDSEAIRARESLPRSTVLARAQSVSVAPAAAPGTTRLGHFAPTSHVLERPAASALPDTELRMPDIVKGLQTQLAKRGYEPGTADGMIGLATRAAIMAYEHDQGLPLTAEPSEHLLAHMQGVASPKPASGRTPKTNRAPNAEQLLRTAQQALTMLGYYAGKVDGLGSEDTVRAIREYEMDSGLVPSGRISAPLILRLARATTTRSTAR